MHATLQQDQEDGSCTLIFSFQVDDPFADVLDPANKLRDDIFGWFDFDDCFTFMMKIDWSESVPLTP